MPTRVAKLCSYPQCPNPGSVRGKCPIHAKTVEKRRNERRAESKAVYNSKRWQELRREVLESWPYCQWVVPYSYARCNKPATDVDHIQPISMGGDPWSRTNLQSLCHQHHSMKTRKEQG